MNKLVRRISIKNIPSILTFLFFSIILSDAAYAQDFGLPLGPGQSKTSTTISYSRDGISWFVDWSNPLEYRINIGADPQILKRHARSGALSGGMTTDQANKFQKIADIDPVFWANLQLFIQAEKLWSSVRGTIEQMGTPYPDVVFNLVMIIRNPDGTQQDHLVSSFTCTRDVYQLCDEHSFEKLPDFQSTTWIREEIDKEGDKNRKP